MGPSRQPTSVGESAWQGSLRIEGNEARRAHCRAGTRCAEMALAQGACTV